jgi:hypothetical protein
MKYTVTPGHLAYITAFGKVDEVQVIRHISGESFLVFVDSRSIEAEV